MVDQLADDYADEPVLFLEHDVDDPAGQRYGRWWAGYNDSGALLPLTMVDSGRQVNSGATDFYDISKSMVDAALARQPKAEITAYHQRSGDDLHVYGKLSNRSGVSLSPMANGAAIHALVYEEAQIGATSRFVHAAPWSDISPGLASGETMTFTLSATLTGVNWDKVRSVALADYRPDGGAFDMLQAAVTQPATFTVGVDSLAFVMDTNDPRKVTVPVGFGGPHVLRWTATESLDWIELSAVSGSISEPLLVSVDPVGLSPGWQHGSITFTASSSSGLSFQEEVPVSAYYGSLVRVYLPAVMR